MSITPEPPLKTCEGRLKHGSILNGNIGLRRVSSQWKSTLAFFTRPDRDLNHRLIGEIRRGEKFSAVAPAPEGAVRSYMLARECGSTPDAGLFVTRHGALASTSHGRRYLHLDWWPVGQGLFSSGALSADNGPRFNWVYDCGTSSKGSLLANAIKCCNSWRSALGFSRFDLAILSHFDKDHISGFSQLVQASRIRMILLPYLTPLQRILLALQEGVSADDAEFGFYVDPVSYLNGLDGSDIGEIVFVLPSEQGDEPPPPPIEPGPDLEGPEAPPIKFMDDTPPEGSQDELFSAHENVRVP